MAADTSKVVLKLAHHLNPEQAERAGAEPKHYKPGDDLTVPAGYAMTVINAGLAQVDPQDATAVRSALASHPDAPGDDASGGAAKTANGVPAPRTPAA